jgi:hypothetical protein
MSISTVTRLVAISGVLLFSAQFAPGQTQDQPTDCITTDASNCDLHATITDIAPPDSPAFAVLGLNPTNVSKPNSPAELASSVLNAFDDNGHFQSGAAVDFVPFLVFRGRSFVLGQYTASTTKAAAVRVLARTGVSFATTKGTSLPDTAVRLALGFRASLIDSGDPRAAFQRCVGDIDVHVVPQENPDAPPTYADKKNKPVSEADFKQMVTDCRTKAGGKIWNANSLVVAGALSWVSTDGSTSNLKSNGGAYWASAGWNMKTNWAQLIVSGRRQTGQSVVPASTSSGGTAPSSAAFVIQDTTVAGGSFKFGRSDFNGNVAGLYIGKRTAGKPDSYPEFGFGIERKLVNNLYLQLDYRYDVTQKSASGLLTNLKWSFSQQARLKTH